MRMIEQFGAAIVPQLPEIRQWSMVLHHRSRGPLPQKRNCWQVMNCGREEGGQRAGRNGACPASIETRLHAIHGGRNAGRACWTVDGTLCRDGRPDDITMKTSFCRTCDFYRILLREEQPHLIVSDETLHMLVS